MVDGIDAFEIDLRRLLYREAQQRGIYALGAGPLGFAESTDFCFRVNIMNDIAHDLCLGLAVGRAHSAVLPIRVAYFEDVRVRSHRNFSHCCRQ